MMQVHAIACDCIDRMRMMRFMPIQYKTNQYNQYKTTQSKYLSKNLYIDK